MPECRGPECPRPAIAKGLCVTHRRQERAGKPLTVIGPRTLHNGAKCGGPECPRLAKIGGLCGTHDMQKRSGNPLTPIRVYKPKGAPCAVGPCGRKSVCDGLCRTHYGRRLHHEPDWDRPIEPRVPMGAGHLAEDGYRYVRHRGRQIGEHRVLAEGLLIRELLATETVHHRNGNRSDNRTSGPFALDSRGRLRSGNLEVWSHSQPAGQEIGPKLDWALELLATYADYLDEPRRAQLVALAGAATLAPRRP